MPRQYPHSARRDVPALLGRARGCRNTCRERCSRRWRRRGPEPRPRPAPGSQPVSRGRLPAGTPPAVYTPTAGSPAHDPPSEADPDDCDRSPTFGPMVLKVAALARVPGNVEVDREERTHGVLGPPTFRPPAVPGAAAPARLPYAAGPPRSLAEFSPVALPQDAPPRPGRSGPASTAGRPRRPLLERRPFCSPGRPRPMTAGPLRQDEIERIRVPVVPLGRPSRGRHRTCAYRRRT